jgi:hypothetical protein
LADVDGENRTAGALDAIDDLSLDREGADEAVEVRDDDDVSAAVLDHVNCAPEAGTLSQWRAAADVELLEDLEQREFVTVAGRGDTLALFGRRNGVLAGAGDANDANGPARGGFDGC